MLKSISLGIWGLCVFCASNALWAQESNTSCSVKGLYAVQFAMDKDFDWNSFEGSLISLKYHITNQWALRMGLSADAYSQSIDLFRKLNGAEYNSAEECEALRLDLSLIFMTRIRQTEYTRFSLGLGPVVSLYNEERERAYEDTEERLYRYEQSVTAYGLQGVASVEIFIRKYISVLIEYGVQLIKETRSHEGNPGYANDNRSENASREVIRFGAKPFKLGFSVYF